VAQFLMLDLRMERSSTTTANGDEPLWVAGDKPALLRLLRILLDNACKFTPPGGAISVIAIQSNDNVLLAVEDSGIGIPDDQHERIFERFYRVCGDRAAQRSGSGLGLSLAAWIAEQHNTTIKLRSTTGAGSCFEFSLNRMRDEGIGLSGVAKQAQQTHEILSRNTSQDLST
jgi:signal transduction histidine kinase